uniref:Ig-like domain-containing protein n=1 Tax=Pygocentrus nattereri TaxID=42514 RepID=A0AAR2JMT8_PYGNA
MGIFDHSSRSAFVRSDTDVGQKGLAHSLHSNSSQVLRSGLCAGQSSSSTPNSVTHVFVDFELCTGVQSCCNRKGPSPTCSHNVGSMKLSKISWSAEALRVSFTGTKGPTPTLEKQPHTIIPPPPNFTHGTMQSDKNRSPDNFQTQTRPSYCQMEKRDSSLQRTRLHCSRVQWQCITLLHSMLLPVSKPYILLSDSSPVEGTSVWMRCGLENGTDPVNYIWEQESRSGVVTTLAESNRSLVNVTWVTRNHTGWYRCLARNEVNQQRSDRIWLDVIYGPDLPQIDVTPYSVTERGYSALEKETVSLMCQALSNPPSQYVWFYNNSQVYTGPQLTITKILRMHTGNYACLAQNTYLNTRSKKTITLTVYCKCSCMP